MISEEYKHSEVNWPALNPWMINPNGYIEARETVSAIQKIGGGGSSDYWSNPSTNDNNRAYSLELNFWAMYPTYSNERRLGFSVHKYF